MIFLIKKEKLLVLAYFFYRMQYLGTPEERAKVLWEFNPYNNLNKEKYIEKAKQALKAIEIEVEP